MPTVRGGLRSLALGARVAAGSVPGGSVKAFVVRVPEVGSLVLDTATGKPGVFMSVDPWGRAYLRPEGGGTEWDTDVEHLVPVGGVL